MGLARHSWVIVVMVAFLGGCFGTNDSSPSGGSSAVGSKNVKSSPNDPIRLTPVANLRGVDPKDYEFIESCDVEVKADPGVRRLSNREIINSINHLFAVDVTDLFSELPPDNVGGGFKNARRDNPTPEIFISKMTALAEEFATRASASPVLAERYLISNCANSDACRDAFINKAGLSLFRRPLTAEKLSRYQQLFVAVQKDAEGSFEAAIKAVLTAMFQSPF